MVLNKLKKNGKTLELLTKSTYKRYTIYKYYNVRIHT